MKANYYTWYPCEKGSMPEDFINCVKGQETVTVLVQTIYNDLFLDCREGDEEGWEWESLYHAYGMFSDIKNYKAWMLIRKYNDGN